jgi:hypothetical protein
MKKSMKFHGIHEISHGIQWNCMGFSMKCHGIPWNFMKLRLMKFHGIPWKSM